jgi:radical SAM superfamily enzyme YgiQ (UPF0313 family)
MYIWPKFCAHYQRRHGGPFTFGTEVSLNLAQDRELLELFRDAGFAWVFVGIESSDPQTLRIEGLREQKLPDLNRLLARLARHGSRVSTVIDKKTRKLVRVDSSVFHLVLEPDTA